MYNVFSQYSLLHKFNYMGYDMGLRCFCCCLVQVLACGVVEHIVDTMINGMHNERNGTQSHRRRQPVRHKDGQDRHNRRTSRDGPPSRADHGVNDSARNCDGRQRLPQQRVERTGPHCRGGRGAWDCAVVLLLLMMMMMIGRVSRGDGVR